MKNPEFKKGYEEARAKIDRGIKKMNKEEIIKKLTDAGLTAEEYVFGNPPFRWESVHRANWFYCGD